MSKSTNAGRCESIRSFCRSGVLRMIACRRAEQRTGLTWKINISPENGTLGRDVFEVNYLVVLAKGEVSLPTTLGDVELWFPRRSGRKRQGARV